MRTNDKYRSNIHAAAVLALLGGACWLASPALPWAQLGMLQANGFQKLGPQAYIYLIIGLLTVAAGVTSLVQHKEAGIVASGLLALVGAVLHYGAAHMTVAEQLKDVRIGSPSIGAGIYMPYVGGALLLFALLGVVMAGKRPVEQDQEEDAPPALAGDPKARLRRLDELRSDGTITEDEWQRRREEILREI